MLRRILFTALIAGTVAGLFAAGIQHLKLIPLIAAAEVYETAGAHPDHQHGAAPEQQSAAPEWEPAPGIERAGYTVLADVLAGIGFALALIRALPPAIGRPPELPGMAAAGLAPRQQWWLLTAAATAGGLGLIIFARPAASRGAGAALIVLPHLIGAPAAPHASTGGAAGP